MQRVVIIGAGLAGLTCALRLGRAGIAVRIAEAGDRVGGQIWTDRSGGYLVERGGEGFVFRSEAVPQLAADVGLGDALIAQAVLTSYGLGEQGLVALAPGEAAQFLGFQVPREDLGRGIRSLRLGMGSLTEALESAATALGVQIHRACPAETIELEIAQAPRGLLVHTRQGAWPADAVVVATTAAGAAPVLSAALSAEPELVAQLQAAPTLSSVTVELAFERDAIEHPLDGTGFVVATSLQQEGLRACTFTSSKFLARAPADTVLLRAFFRPETADRALDDQAFTARAVGQISRALRVRKPALRSWVSRWPDALPVHSTAHAGLIASIEQHLHPRNIVLAGSAFHGAGIDAAVRSGERAATMLAAALPTKQARP